MQLRTSALESGHPSESQLTKEQALTRLALSDYVALTKPRIISLLLLTTLVPMYLATSSAPGPMLIFWVMLGGFLAAGGANTINQFVDRKAPSSSPGRRPWATRWPRTTSSVK